MCPPRNGSAPCSPAPRGDSGPVSEPVPWSGPRSLSAPAQHSAPEEEEAAALMQTEEPVSLQTPVAAPRQGDVALHCLTSQVSLPGSPCH